jgi:hypothetical protein
MKNLLLTVLAFGLVSSSAFAEEGLEKKQWTRVVPSGTNQRIGFFYWLNPDCSSAGNVNVRVTKQPEHGSTETVTTSNFPFFSKDNVRAKCNEHKVRGVQRNYKSAEKYTGQRWTRAARPLPHRICLGSSLRCKRALNGATTLAA